jgi:leucyl-tRNA synthetase
MQRAGTTAWKRPARLQSRYEPDSPVDIEPHEPQRLGIGPVVDRLRHLPRLRFEGLPRVFSLVIPPPNVTGSLHMGHMLEHTEIDVTVRWHRMRGDNTLWLPGTDHAGIATQMVVEPANSPKRASTAATSAARLSKRVWQWKAESGGSPSNAR